MKKNGAKVKMNKKMKIVFYFTIAMIAIAALIYFADKIMKENSDNFDYKNKNYCTPESRNAEVCITLYEPVCGWFNESIKCVRYPCAATYSNKCFACQDPKVEYWTEGECPK
ncbi:MAG: hypothetical protein QXO35_03660 [Candidatus Micrarchaeia archaeon]